MSVQDLADKLRKKRRLELTILRAENALMRFALRPKHQPEVEDSPPKKKTIGDFVFSVFNGCPMTSSTVIRAVQAKHDYTSSAIRNALTDAKNTGQLEYKGGRYLKP